MKTHLCNLVQNPNPHRFLGLDSVRFAWASKAEHYGGWIAIYASRTARYVRIGRLVLGARIAPDSFRNWCWHWPKGVKI